MFYRKPESAQTYDKTAVEVGCDFFKTQLNFISVIKCQEANFNSNSLAKWWKLPLFQWFMCSILLHNIFLLG